MQESVDYELIPGLKLRPEEQFIIHCLRRTLGPKNDDGIAKTDLSTIDWNIVYEKSMHWGVAPLLNKIIKEQSALPQFPDIPDYFLRKIKIAYLATFLANETTFKGLAELLRAFNKARIKVIFLKGSHLSQFVYRDVGLRQMSDIDILVKVEDLDKAEELLFQMGYYYPELGQGTYDYSKVSSDTRGQADLIERYRTNHHHLHPFSRPKGIKHLEIHWTITPSPSPFSIDVEGLWERSKISEINWTGALQLSPEDLLLHLSLHASYNHRLESCGLRPYYDIAATISRYQHEIDWEQLQMRAYEWRCEKYLYLTLHMSKELLGANVPTRLLRALKPNPFSEKIALEAKKRILSLEPKTKGMRWPARVHIFRPDESLSKKVSFLLNRLKKIYISPTELAARYSLPASSKRVYLYYFVHFTSVLYTYARVYVPYFLHALVYKKESLSNYNIDLWLTSPVSRKK